MYDAIHIEIKIVEFDTVRVRFNEIDGDEDSILALSGLLLDHVQDRERVSIGKPSIKGWDSHGFSPDLLAPDLFPIWGPRQKSPNK